MAHLMIGSFLILAWTIASGFALTLLRANVKGLR
jgi:hypothetical protein